MFTIGLDLGQSHDYTALAVLERSPPTYAVRHLQRYPLGMSYPAVVDQIFSLTTRDPLRGSTLLVDYTGVGRPVVDALREARLPVTLIPVSITSGSTVTRGDDGSYRVPKRELVTTLQALLHSRRLTVAQGLAEADILIRELQAFRVKITASANEVYGAIRHGDHDDIVLAVALACWWEYNHVA